MSGLSCHVWLVIIILVIIIRSATVLHQYLYDISVHIVEGFLESYEVNVKR